MAIPVKIPPMQNALLDRIEQRLKAVGIDATTAEKRAGVKEAIRNLRRRVRDGHPDAGLTTGTLLKLAPVLETTAAWLIDGVDCGTMEVPESMRQLWTAFVRTKNTNDPDFQKRVAEFTEAQLHLYEKSREIDTNPVSP